MGYPIQADMPVRPTPCRHCPFAGSDPIKLSAEEYAGFYHALITFKASHLCHLTPRLRCRGGRDIQLASLHRQGIIAQPTEESYREKLQAAADINTRVRKLCEFLDASSSSCA